MTRCNRASVPSAGKLPKPIVSRQHQTCTIRLAYSFQYVVMGLCSGIQRCAKVGNCKSCHSFGDVTHGRPRAKYPLSIVARTMDAGIGPVHFAFDIGCAFDGTVKRSSLSQRACAAGLSFSVNSFHGYGHNRRCQLRYHPLYRKGFGLEDLETCERFFSGSNEVAAIVRHASHFHWLQAIHIFMLQWDADKYRELSETVARLCAHANFSCRQVFVQQRSSSAPNHQGVHTGGGQVQARERHLGCDDR